jgi:hypothetical protein
MPYYKHTPANVGLLENDNFKLYWNRRILTDKTVPFNRPDIIFINKKIDIAVPNTHNLAKTFTDKQKKRIPFIFNDESTGSCIWRLRHIHVNTMRV